MKIKTNAIRSSRVLPSCQQNSSLKMSSHLNLNTHTSEEEIFPIKTYRLEASLAYLLVACQLSH